VEATEPPLRLSAAQRLFAQSQNDGDDEDGMNSTQFHENWKKHSQNFDAAEEDNGGVRRPSSVKIQADEQQQQQQQRRNSIQTARRGSIKPGRRASMGRASMHGSGMLDMFSSVADSTVGVAGEAVGLMGSTVGGVISGIDVR
jgi:hypothetical protein